MSFFDYIWADSDLENITIEFDQAVLTIWNDDLQKRLFVKCLGFAGITNLCIWDDTIILNACVLQVRDTDSEFVRHLYTAYSKESDYGGRSLSNGLLELRIELANHISFNIYCQKIDVQECSPGDDSVC